MAWPIGWPPVCTEATVEDVDNDNRGESVGKLAMIGNLWRPPVRAVPAVTKIIGFAFVRRAGRRQDLGSRMSAQGTADDPVLNVLLLAN